MQTEITTIRHGYDDHSYIDGHNDTPLTAKGLEMARVAARDLSTDERYLDGKRLIIRTSLKQRAIETAGVICDAMSRQHVECDIVKDPGLTELYQGKFNFGDMSHDDRVDFLQSCWDDFEVQRKNYNIDHRFGEYKIKNEGAPIVEMGESHRVWSIDIASATIRTLEDKKRECNSIDVTHRGASFMIAQLARLSNNSIQPVDVEQYETKFMKYCERHTYEINDIDIAIESIQRFINMRRMRVDIDKYENNY